MDIEQVKRELDIIRALLRVDYPFLASLASKVRIGAGDFIEYGACDTDGVIWIGKRFMELPEKQRLFVLGHEVLHAALQHAARRGDRDPTLWNLAADSIVNEVLDQAGIGNCPHFAVRGSNFRLPEGWEHWSVEQVYRWLEEHSIKVELDWEDLLRVGQGEQEDKGGVIIQQGEPTLYGEGEAAGEGSEDRQRRWQRELHKAWQVAKTAGKCPAGLDRWLENLLKPKTDVRALLRAYIREGLGRSVVTNWLRPSRKNPEMPWIKRLTIPTIHALVDSCLVAGSMITMSDGTQKPIEEIAIGDRVLGVENGITNGKVVAKWFVSERQIIRVVLDDGTEIYCTENHRFLTPSGWKKAKNLKPMEPVYVLEQYDRAESPFGGVSRQENRAIQGETLDERGNRFSEEELSEDVSEATCENSQKGRYSNKDEDLRTWNLNNFGRQVSRAEKVFEEDFNARGSRLLGWTDRRRRNYNIPAEKKNNNGGENRSNRPLHSYFQLQQGTVEYREGKIQIQNGSKAAKNIKITKERELSGLRRGFWHSANIGGNMPVSEVKEKAVRDSDELHKAETEEASTYAIYTRGYQRLLDSQRAKLGFRKVVKVEKTSRTEGVFDLTTTTHNYFVNNVLCHNSGSIGEQELSLFFGTLQEFMSQTEITVTCWDAEAYETVKVRGRDILPWVKGKIKGGGGTVIAPALKKTLERMKPGDIVVVLTDGYIYDKTDEKTRDLAVRIAGRSGASIFLWTGEKVSMPGWRSVRLEA